MTRFGLQCRAALAAGLLGPTMAMASTVGDSFDDGRTDATLWTVQTEGGPTIRETGGSCTVEVPATSSGSIFYARYVSVPMFVGDFDAKVDYALDLWPAGNGLRVGLSIEDADSGMACERTNFGPGLQEVYLADFGAYTLWFPTSDTSGSLRWVRTGENVAAYCLQNGEWTLIGGSHGSGGPVRLTLWVWSHDGNFGHQDARILFDDFFVQDSASHRRIAPETETVRTGKVRSGTLQDLADDDDSSQILAKFLVPNMSAPIVRVDLTYRSDLLQPKALSSVIRMRHKNAGSYVLRTFQFDYPAQSFVETMSGRPTQAAYGNFIAPCQGVLSRFVRQDDGQTGVRFEIAVTGLASAQLPAFEFEFADQFVAE
ncbi:MAG: hypothetical protein JST30_05095 [Armatimonadetes bacterium]|nr:hypothetical protein [Armatimonadota bacterium]